MAHYRSFCSVSDGGKGDMMFIKIGSHRSREKVYREFNYRGFPAPVAHYKFNGGYAYEIIPDAWEYAKTVKGVTRARDQDGWSKCWTS